VHHTLAFGGAAGGDGDPGGREATDHRRSGPSRTGVRGNADRLVDDDDVVVL